MPKNYPIKSYRGVYYDLSQSPFEVLTSSGVSLKFSSKKKMEIYTRELPIRIKKVENCYERVGRIVGENYTLTPCKIRLIENQLYRETED